MKSALIKHDRVRIVREARLVGPPGARRRPPTDGAAAGEGSEPKVTLRRKGDVIEAIEVVCPCGHEMILDCIYDQAGPATDAPGGGEGPAPGS